jgi:hypothetical protein
MDPQSLNRYAYARNDPLNRVDPSGSFDVHFTGASVRYTGGTYLYDSLGEGGFTGVDVRYQYWVAGDASGGVYEARVFAFGRQPEFAAPELYAVQNGRISDSLSSVGEAVEFLGWLDPEQRNLYVNGINQDVPGDLLASLGANLGSGVLVFNPSDGMLNDLIEAGLQKFLPGSTRLDRVTADLISASGGIERAWGHSQGALTVRNAELIAGVEGARGAIRHSVLAGLPGHAIVAIAFRSVAGGSGWPDVRQHRHDPISAFSLAPYLVLTGSYGLVVHQFAKHDDYRIYRHDDWRAQ